MIDCVCQLFPKWSGKGVGGREKYKHAVVSHLLFAQIDCLGFCLMLKPVIIHNLFLNILREKAYLLSYNTGNDIKLCYQDHILSHIMSDITFQFGFSDQLRSDLMICSDHVPRRLFSLSFKVLLHLLSFLRGEQYLAHERWKTLLSAPRVWVLTELKWPLLQGSS